MKRKPVLKIEKIARIMIALTIGLVGFIGVFLPGVPAALAESSWCGTYFQNGTNSRIDPDHGTTYGIIDWTDVFSPFTTGNDPFYIDTTMNILEVASGDMGGIDVFNNSNADRSVRVFEYSGGAFVQLLFTLASGTDDHIPEGVTQILIDSPSGAGDPAIGVTLGKSCAPTATPTPVYATPFPPQPTACVTAMPTATATHQATPTPLIQRTPTPGGPTATPGPSATGTPLPSFDSGVASFAQLLQPWTATEHFSFGGLYVTEWRSDAGPDGNPGVAFTKDFAGLLDNPAGPLTTTEPLSGSLTFSRPGGMFFPFRVTGSVKWSTSILGGESAYLRAWYYDPDYVSPGQGAWVTDPPNWRDQFGADWSHFSFSLTQHGGSGRVTAVAISEEFDGGERSGEGAMLDDLRVYSGPQAVAGSFPICQGTGAGGPRPIVTKTCNIVQIVVDVYASCVAPTSLIDVVGWLSYWFCRILRYFSFLPQNRQQVTDLIARQSADEPFGTFIETSDIIGVTGDMLKDISSTYSTNAVTYRTIDWSVMWNFRQLDDIPAMLHIPNDPGVLQRYRSDCPSLSQDSMNGSLFRQYGCLIIVFTRDKLPLLGAFQWVIDISSIIGLVISARKFLSNIAT